jgi:hypothetical protein
MVLRLGSSETGPDAAEGCRIWISASRKGIQKGLNSVGRMEGTWATILRHAASRRSS